MSRRSVLATVLVGAALLAAPVLPHAGAVDDPNNAYPSTAECANFADAKLDGKIASSYTRGTAADSSTPNDPDLDIHGVALHATPVAFKIFVKVATLAAKPAYAPGHVFRVTFKVAEKTVTLTDAHVDKVDNLNVKSVTGTNSNSSVKLDVAYDTAKSYVVFTLDRPTFEAAVPGGLAPGAAVTNLSATSLSYFGPSNYDTADVASPPVDPPYTYKVGLDDLCFPPPPSKLVYTGAVKGQFSDAVTVAAKLTNEAGTTPIAGKAIKFTIGSKSITAVTGTDGVASTPWDHGLTAGGYTLVASWAGDQSAAAATAPATFTVSPEVTKMTFRVIKSGQKRTVVATVKDDDGKYVVGQTVKWYINNRYVAAGRTNGSGAVTLATAKPTQTVKGEFVAVSGKYNKSTYTAKV